ncbi:nitronate monooxygenase, partial [Acinetobacter baumannii]
QPARADSAREAAWLEHLRPQFERVGAKPPSGMKEIYESFVGDDAMLALLTATRPRIVSFHFGLPDEQRIRALRAAGIALLAAATNLEEGRA